MEKPKGTKSGSKNSGTTKNTRENAPHQNSLAKKTQMARRYLLVKNINGAAEMPASMNHEETLVLVPKSFWTKEIQKQPTRSERAEHKVLTYMSPPAYFK